MLCKAMPERANARLTAIKFAGRVACQVVVGTRSVVLKLAVESCSCMRCPWTVRILSNTRPNPSTNR